MNSLHPHDLSHRVAYTLKEPLYTLILNFSFAASQRKIALSIGHFFAALVCIIPALILWCLGKLIYLANPVRINTNNLAKVPIAIPRPDALALKDIKLKKLGNIIDDLISTSRYPVSKGDFSIDRGDGKTDKLTLIYELYNSVEDRSSQTYIDDDAKNELFWDELTNYLKAIIVLLEGETLTKDDKELIITELADAKVVCAPTWLEVSKDIYNRYTPNGSTQTATESILLAMVTKYKEEMTLAFTQNSLNTQWHTLNLVRELCGKDLGLKEPGLDISQTAPQTMGAAFIKLMFMKEYEQVDVLIEAIKNMINMHILNVSSQLDHTNNITEIIAQERKDKKSTDLEQYIEINENDDGDDLYNITHAGTELVLRHLGIIT